MGKSLRQVLKRNEWVRQIILNDLVRRKNQMQGEIDLLQAEEQRLMAEMEDKRGT